MIIKKKKINSIWKAIPLGILLAGLIFGAFIKLNNTKSDTAQTANASSQIDGKNASSIDPGNTTKQKICTELLEEDQNDLVVREYGNKAENVPCVHSGCGGVF